MVDVNRARCQPAQDLAMVYGEERVQLARCPERHALTGTASYSAGYHPGYCRGR